LPQPEGAGFSCLTQWRRHGVEKIVTEIVSAGQCRSKRNGGWAIRRGVQACASGKPCVYFFYLFAKKVIKSNKKYEK
jgi:hypothetical protein